MYIVDVRQFKSFKMCRVLSHEFSAVSASMFTHCTLPSCACVQCRLAPSVGAGACVPKIGADALPNWTVDAELTAGDVDYVFAFQS